MKSGGELPGSRGQKALIGPKFKKLNEDKGRAYDLNPRETKGYAVKGNYRTQRW